MLLLEVQVSIILLFHRLTDLSLLLKLASAVVFDVIDLPDGLFVSLLLNKTQVLDPSVVLVANSLIFFFVLVANSLNFLFVLVTKYFNFLCVFFGLITNVFIIFGINIRQCLRVGFISSQLISNRLSVTLLHQVLKVFNQLVVGCFKFGNVLSGLCLSCAQILSILNLFGF